MVTGKLVDGFWKFSASSAVTNSPRTSGAVLSYDDRLANRQWVRTLATLLSSTLGNILIVVGTAFLVRTLGGEAFGKAALLTTAAITLGTVTSSGICLHILRATAREVSDEEVRTQVWIGILMGQGIAAFITIIFVCMAAFQGGRSLLEYCLTALALHFTTSDALSKNRLIGGQRLVPLAGATILGSMSTVGLQLLGAWVDGSQGYMVGFAVGTGLQAASSWLACRFALPAVGGWPKKIFQRMANRELLVFVTLATLSACVVPLAHWINSIIAAQKMNSYDEVAKLTVAMQFFNMVIFVPTVLNKIILPKTIKDDFNRDIDGSQREARRQAWRMVLYTAPMLPLVWALSGPITAVYHFSSSDGIAIILCFVGASVLACAAIPLSNHFVSHSKMKRGFVGNLLWAVFYLGLAWALPGGAISTAVSLLCAYALNLIIVLLLIHAGHNDQ